MTPTIDRLAPVLDWLHREGRLMANLGRLIDQLMTRSVAAGLPIWRFYLGLQLVHPQMLATGFLWRRGAGFEEVQRAHGIQNTSAYIGSPMQEARDQARIVRYDLTALGESHHLVLHELRDGGGTDYIAFPMRISREGPMPIASFATDRAGGFDEADLADIERLVDGIGPLAEIYIHRGIADTVVNTYLGRQVGERILKGAIRRGDGEEIQAVLCFSDLRDFTGLHIGPVTFGNVGTQDRLDFTVIGPAVNRAARLESLTKELKVPVCASSDFKDVCTQPLVSLGRHALRGVAEPVEVFTIP